MSDNPWLVAPEYQEVQAVMSRIGKLKAMLRILSFEIEDTENVVKLEKPRDTAARFAASRDLQKRQAELEAELFSLIAQVDLLNYRKDMFKSMVYNQRGV